MRRVCAAYGLLGLALWPIPLLNVLQVEAAAVVAFVAFFAAGWAATRTFQTGDASVWAVLGRQEGALVIPLGMLTVAQLWAPNCTFGQGLLFYVLFPGITVVFAVTLAYALTGTNVRRPELVLVGVGVGVSLLGPLYDLGFHPQFYTYNHVFGGVLGPIYDEQLAVRTGLFVHRGLTVLWAGALVSVGRWLRGKDGGWMGLVFLAGIAGVYGWSVPLGLNTSADHIQETLGGHVQTEHFDVYYDPDRLDRRAVEAVADDHEAAYAQIRRRLDLDSAGSERIQSFLYPTPDVKAHLTGARYTSVAPVWLDDPQIHLLSDRVESSLGHEVAHVLSRPYGLPVLGASWSPGLVEGWAVALEPPSLDPSPDALVRVAASADTASTVSLKAQALADRLTPWGFWTGRGAVSYATMGSFVGYLLEQYGPDRLKEVYAWGNFEEVYGRPLSVLVREWSDDVHGAPVVSRAAHAAVTQRFTRPSLFETECPHYVPPSRRHLQAAARAQRRGDTTQVRHHLKQSLAAAPQSIAAHGALAQLRLAEGRAVAVRRQLDTLASSRQTPALRRLQADAHALTGDTAAAHRHYREALRRLPPQAHDARARLLLRTAVTDRPAVVKILVSGDSAHVQADSLARRTGSATPAVQAWQALRYGEAHRYARADAVWQQVSSPPSFRWPRGWRQAYALQEQMWRGTTAYRAGRPAAAESTLTAAARRAAAHGAESWAETMEAWAERAKRARSSDERAALR